MNQLLKKIIVFGLCGTTCFFLAACRKEDSALKKQSVQKDVAVAAAEEEKKINKEDGAVAEQALSFSQKAMAKNSDVTEIFQALEKSRKGAVTKEQLEATLSEFQKKIGYENSSGEPTVKQQGEMRVVTIPAMGKKRDGMEEYYFDKKIDLIGYFLKMGDIKERETKAFLERPFDITVEGVKIPGALVMPKGVENPPLALLISGSGPNDMNETLGDNAPLQDIAYGLAQEGIASYRMDKISLHQIPQQVTVDWEYVKPYEQALKALKNQEGLKQSKIILIGHSQGAMMAPTIAKKDGKVHSMVLLAGTLKSLQEVIQDQTLLALSQNKDMPEKESHKKMLEMREAVDQINHLKETDQKTLLGLPASYWYSLNQINRRGDLQAFQGPIFIAQGDSDFQVEAEKNLPLYKEALGSRAEYKIYPKVNHLLFSMDQQPTMTVKDYEGTHHVSEEIIHDIANFIKNK